MAVRGQYVRVWVRRKMAEEKAKRDAPPLDHARTSAYVNKLGGMSPDEKAAYLDLLVEQGRLTPVQRDYVLRVSQGALL